METFAPEPKKNTDTQRIHASVQTHTHTQTHEITIPHEPTKQNDKTMPNSMTQKKRTHTHTPW